MPSQVSARSHSPAAPRQTVVLGSMASAGQPPPRPVQVSCTSQLPAAGRHTVPAGTRQLFAASLQRFSQAGPPRQGSPPPATHAPALQVSAPEQNRPSSHSAFAVQSTQAGITVRNGSASTSPTTLSHDGSVGPAGQPQ